MKRKVINAVSLRHDFGISFIRMKNNGGIGIPIAKLYYPSDSSLLRISNYIIDNECMFEKFLGNEDEIVIVTYAYKS